MRSVIVVIPALWSVAFGIAYATASVASDIPSNPPAATSSKPVVHLQKHGDWETMRNVWNPAQKTMALALTRDRWENGSLRYVCRWGDERPRFELTAPDFPAGAGVYVNIELGDADFGWKRVPSVKLEQTRAAVLPEDVLMVDYAEPEGSNTIRIAYYTRDGAIRWTAFSSQGLASAAGITDARCTKALQLKQLLDKDRGQ